MSEPKKHHFVPQFLLRGLLPERGDMLWVFDKWTGKVWKSPTRDIAAEHKFNLIKADDVELDLEPYMGQMEDAVSPLVERLRATRSLKWLGAAGRRKVALFTAAQMLRTPAALAKHKAIDDLLKEGLSRRGGDPYNVEGYEPFAPGDEKNFWGEIYMTETPKIATHLLMKDWMLFDSSSSEFYMSDAPVTLFNHVERPGRGNLGVACEGIQIHLPLARNLTLALVCPTIRRELKSAKRSAARNPFLGNAEKQNAFSKADEIIRAVDTGRPLQSAPENVIFLNSLQVSNSERFVYSTSGDFELATEMVTTHPINRTGRRPQLA